MIASAWVVLNAVGVNGYMALAKKTMETTVRLNEIIASIPELGVRSRPDMTSLAIVSLTPKVNILAVADVMDSFGWKMERQQLPDSLHLTMMPHHAMVIEQLGADLSRAVERIKVNPKLNSTGTTGMYGMVASIPDKTLVDDFIIKFFSSLFSAAPGTKSIVSEFGSVDNSHNTLSASGISAAGNVEAAEQSSNGLKGRLTKSPVRTKSPARAKSPAKAIRGPKK
jgi:hypothetical protein